MVPHGQGPYYPSDPPWPLYTDPYPSPGPDPGPFHELDSSIGPSRVLTRRQRAALEQHAPLARRPQPYDPALQRMYPASISRPQTPPNHDYQQRETLSLNVSATPIVQPSPSYHPLTPSSSASPYSTYGFYSTTHSRSASLSNTNPRSASPALSTASALTSVSSSASGQNSFAVPSTAELEARVKQKKQRLFNVDRKDICLYHKENPGARQEDIARIYGVERSTISKILKNKTKWLNVPADENLRIAKHRPSKFPEIEEDMVKWLLQCRDTNTVLSDSMIRNKAKEVARDLGIPEERFKASSGWIENFKHRHGVRAGVWTGDGRNARAARSQGLGGPPITHDAPLLSPLNPGFNEQDRMMDDAEPPDLSPGPEDSHVRRMDTSSDMPIRPSWLLPQHSHPADPAPPPPPPHPSVPPSRQLSGHSPHQQAGYSSAPPVYDVVYEAPPRPEPETTTLAEAEVAINKVIHFIDTQGHGILQPHERNMLTTIKCALFQAASGIAYDRTVLPYEQGDTR
ncbi:Tc5 transposase DNA-binding domain-containing protein [Mycena belliarum]|uniref:Tc5 transposase DNA-binding domain-containing protein n=1 Tax=Mycena belliarum TaxID=1033014 RepID=A0AAD6U9R5_9AGAR|nr:Tc5 transposase DNA-binding domain-containing protein [Mycena belliae]